MKHKNQNYSKNEPNATPKNVVATPKNVVAKRVIEETDSVQEAQELQEFQAEPVKERTFKIKVGTDKWFKSWSPVFALCDDESEAIVLNEDWARGHLDRIKNIKKMKAVIVEL